MADTNIKKVTIPISSLPYVDIDSAGLFYNVRYRIISEDKNRVSHWSKIYRVDMPSTTDADLPYTTAERIHVNKVGSSPKTVIVTWSHPLEADLNPNPIKAQLEKIFDYTIIYDVWIRWSTLNTPDPNNPANWVIDWTYFSTVSADTFSIFVPSGYNAIGVAIQLPTVEKTRDNRLTIFQTQGNNL
jgi:hypothetical protein